MNRVQWFDKVCWNSLVVVTQTGSAIGNILRSRVGSTLPVLAHENIWDSQNSSRTALQRFSWSRDGFRFGKTHTAAQRTRRTRTFRNTMPCNTTVDTRETLVGESSGHEEQHYRSLHETSGWIANALARKLGLRILDGTNGDD